MKGTERTERDWKGMKGTERTERDWKGMKRTKKDWKGMKRTKKDWKGLKGNERDWKGLVGVFSNDLRFIEEHPGFTTVPFKSLNSCMERRAVRTVR